MENQTDIRDQNTQQIGQNATSQQQPTQEKQKTNHLLIGGIILISFALFGFGGYYLGKQSSKSNIELNQDQTVPLSPTNEVGSDANWNAYKNTQYSFVFNYPKNYVILTKPDCSELIGNQSACLMALSINASNSDYPSTAHFWLLKGINSVRISGQVSSINFDPQKNVWVLNEGISPAQTLPAWDNTKSGQEIIKTSNGGSHGSSNYFLIPNFKYDEIAIFSIPQSFRLRCDNFTSDKSKEVDCNNFYKSIIDKYNEGKTTVDTWLPDNYLSSIYSEAETMIKSFKKITDINNGDVEKAIDILKAIPEVQIIQNAVAKNGRKVFFSQGDVRGDIVKISLMEGGFPDQHTTRIDTFNVNVKSNVITVDDVAMISGQEFITLDAWKKTVNERFK